MHRALIIVVVVAMATSWILLRPTEAERDVLAVQTAETGGVEVTVTPVRLDGTSATFDITFDTHTAELDGDPADGAALLVGSISWGSPRWDGDPPGGHHRSGRLTFTAAGPVRGPVRLEVGVGGLPELLTFDWSQARARG